MGRAPFSRTLQSVSAAFACAACLARGDVSPGAAPPASSSATSPPADAAPPPPQAGAQATGKGDVGTPRRSGRLLTIEQARAYMVELINRDRASAGLGAVVLDGGPATRAGQGHADDMARHGYLGHWGMDGSVPEQRFTEAGGVDMVLENASCFTDERSRKIDPAPRIDPADVERAEDMFFHERPPNDGHRQNILKRWHKRVGIGVAMPVATPTEIPTPCFAQEFVDPYGRYAPIARRVRVGETLHVEGDVVEPASFAGVGLARTDAPAALAVSELNRRRSYPIPAPYQMYWPPGYETPIPVHVAGRRFSIDLPVGDHGRPGLYELSVWATFPGSNEPAMVSLRTFDAR